MHKVLLTLVGLMSCLLAGRAAPGQPIYYNTSSTILSQNTLDSVTTNGSGNAVLITATGVDFNKLNRCTAVAVDGLNGKLFLVDGAANAIWSVNLNGSGLTFGQERLDPATPLTSHWMC